MVFSAGMRDVKDPGGNDARPRRELFRGIKIKVAMFENINKEHSSEEDREN